MLLNVKINAIVYFLILISIKMLKYVLLYVCVYTELVIKHTILVPLYIKSMKIIHCKIILLTFSFNIFSSCGLNDIVTNEQGKEQNTGQVKKEKEK